MFWAVVVALLAERVLPILEDLSLNPIMAPFNTLLNDEVKDIDNLQID